MQRPLMLVPVLTLTLLGACGGSEEPTTSDATTSRDVATQPMPGLPGSGLVAAIDGSTAQVQSATSQTAVTWTGATTFTHQVNGSLSDVTVGSCVMVSSTDTDAADASTVAAETVRLVAASDDGTCTGGFGGPGGGDFTGERPEGAPTARPEGAPDGARLRMAGAFGEVTAVSSDGFTVEGTAPGSDDTSTTTVTVSSETTYTTNAEATAAAVKVGVCVTTQGDTDDSGGVTATSIAVSEAVDGECTGGFGRPRFEQEASR